MKTKVIGGVLSVKEGTSRNGNPIAIIEQDVKILRESYVSRAMQARGVQPKIETIERTRHIHIGLTTIDDEGNAILDENKKAELLALDGKQSHTIVVTTAQYPQGTNLEVSLLKDKETGEISYDKRGFPRFSSVNLVENKYAFDVWLPFTDDINMFPETLEELQNMGVNTECYTK